MVDQVIDPVRVPTINLTLEELELMQVLIDEGKLPRDFIERHFDAVDANVFGVDAPKDKKGYRIEQGRGSPLNMTQQSIDAYKKWCHAEPNFAEHLKAMVEQLAEG